MELIRGIVAAPVLPMTEDFEVDWKGLRDYLRWLVRASSSAWTFPGASSRRGTAGRGRAVTAFRRPDRCSMIVARRGP